MEKKKLLVSFQNLIIYFFLCGIIGWILEEIYAYILFGSFVKRGFLYGPICTIYGCGAMLMVLITEFINSKNIKNKLLKLTIEFLAITATFTILEYTASLVLEVIFGLRWWDYSNDFLNVNGRICLIFSLLFGISGVTFIKVIYEPTKKLISKIKLKFSNKTIWSVLITLITIWTIDSVFSVIKYINI